MSVSDSSYKKFAEQVYNVEPSKAKSNGEPVVVKGRIFRDPVTKQKYKVLSVQDNNNDVDTTNDNGMQAMAVAPYVNGKVDTSQIVVAYAGTNSADVKDVDTDIQTIIFGSKDNLVQGNVENQTVTDSQLKTAQKFYDEIKKQYPGAILTTTGHSLGAYLALIIGAENKIAATTFNGPDPIRGMSESAIAWVIANNRMYNNYRIRYDGIGNFGAYFNDVLDSDKLNISRTVHANRLSPNPFFYHDLAAYRFNEDGQIIDKYGNVVGSGYLASNAYSYVLSSNIGMISVHNLKTKWSGGGISSGEEQFLDVAQSYVIGNSMADVAKVGLDELAGLKTRSDSEVETLWSKVDFSIYSDLSAWEVRDIFASHGVTYQQIVTDFYDYTEKKVKKMKKISKTFATLKTKLDNAIEEKKALDDKLAGEFRIWQENL